MPEEAPKTPSRIPVGTDERPSIARVYDYFLGGKDHYAVDVEVAKKVLEAVPEAAAIARGNRAFLGRACRHVARETGIKQFLDCGSGLPTAENTHQIAQRYSPDAIVVYVDNDPVVLAHGRAILAENEQTHIVEADIFDADAVLNNETVRQSIDFTEPVALLHLGTLHHLEGSDGPALMRKYIDALPSGSYVVFSHFFDPEIPELTDMAKRIEDVLVRGPLGAGRFRTRTEIEEMLPGLELLQPNATTPPGVVVCDEWWPDGPGKVAERSAQCIAGAVGRKL